MITTKITAIKQDIHELKTAVAQIAGKSGALLNRLAIVTRLLDGATALRQQDARLRNVALVLDEIVSRIKITSKAENVHSEFQPDVDGCHMEVDVEDVEIFLHKAFSNLGQWIVQLLAYDIVNANWKGAEVQLELTGDQAWALADLLLNGRVEIAELGKDALP